MIQVEEQKKLSVEGVQGSASLPSAQHATCYMLGATFYMLGFQIHPELRECLPGLRRRRGTHLDKEITTTDVIVSWIRPTGFVLLCAPLDS